MLGDVLTSSTPDGGQAALIETERGLLWVEVPRYAHHRAAIIEQRPAGLWCEPANDLAMVLAECGTVAAAMLEDGTAADALQAVDMTAAAWVLSGVFDVEDC